MSSWLGQLGQAAERARQIAAESAEAAQKAAVDAAQRASEEAAKLGEELQDKAKQYANELQEGATAFAQTSEDDGLTFKFEFGPGPLGFKLGADEAGVYVTTVVSGGQAAKHGVNVGDRLFSIGGERLPRNPSDMTQDQAEQKIKDLTVKLRNHPRPVVLAFGFGEESKPSAQQEEAAKETSTQSETGTNETPIANEIEGMDMNGEWENIDFDVEVPLDENSEESKLSLPLADDVSPLVTPSSTPLATAQMPSAALPLEEANDNNWEDLDFDVEGADEEKSEETKPALPVDESVSPKVAAPLAAKHIEAEEIADIKDSTWEDLDFDVEEQEEEKSEDVKPTSTFEETSPQLTAERFETESFDVDVGGDVGGEEPEQKQSEEAKHEDTQDVKKSTDSHEFAMERRAEEELAALRVEYNKVIENNKCQLELSEARVREVQEQADKLREELESTQSDCEFRIEELEGAKKACESALESAQVVVATEKEKAQAMSEEVERLNNRCHDQERQIAIASSLGAELKNARDKLESKEGSEEKEQELGRALEELRSEYDQFRDSAKQQLEEAELQASQRAENDKLLIDKLRQEYECLQTRFDEKDGVVEQEPEDVHEKECKIKELEEAELQARELLQRERNEKKALEEELESLRKSVGPDSTTDSPLDDASQEYEKLKQEFCTLEAQTKEAIVEKDKELEDLRKELDAARSTQDFVTETASTSIEDAQEKDERIKQLEEAESQAKDLLQNERNDRQALEEQLDLLRKSVASDSATNTALGDARLEYDKLKEEFCALEASTRESIDEKDKELEELRRELDVARSSQDFATETASEDAREKDVRIKELEEAELQATEKLQNEQHEKQALEEQLGLLRKSEKDARVEYDNVFQEFRALEARTKETIAEKDQELEDLRKELDIVRNSNDATAEQQLEGARAESLRSKAAMDEKEKEISSLVEQLEIARRDHSLELEELERTNADCKSAIEIASKEKAQADAEIIIEKERVAALIAESQDLHARCSEQEQQLARATSLESELKDARERLEQSQRQVQELQAAQDGTMQSAAEAREQALVRCRTLEQDLAKARNELDETSQEASTSKRNLSEAKKDIETLKQRFEALKIEHDKKATELKQSHATSSTGAKASHEQIKQLNSDIDALRQESAETQQQLKRTQLDLERSRAECQELVDGATQRDNRVNAATALLENRAKSLQEQVTTITEQKDSALLQSKKLVEDLNHARAEVKIAQESKLNADAKHQGESDALQSCIAELQDKVTRLSEQAVQAEKQAQEVVASRAHSESIEEDARAAQMRVVSAEDKASSAELRVRAAEEKATALEAKLLEADAKVESACSESHSHRQLVHTLQSQLAEQQSEFTLQLDAQKKKLEIQLQHLRNERSELDLEDGSSDIGKSAKSSLRKEGFEASLVGKEQELPPEKAGQEETVALRERIDLLENRCATLQNRLSARPIIYQQSIADGNDPLLLESGTNQASSTAVKLVEQVLRKFTHRLLKKDMWLLMFYAHLVVLYLISGSCLSSSRTPTDCLHLKMKESGT